MQKLIISFLLISNISYASNKSLNESTVITHLHYLYSKFKIVGDRVNVKGMKLSKSVKENVKTSEKFAMFNRKFQISLDEFNFEKQLAQNTFQAFSNDNTGMGTAFFIGGNFILTNFHVYNREYVMNKCDQFKIKVNPDLGGETFRCKTAHHCSKELDYCLIEMKEKKKTSLRNYTHHPRLKLEIEQNQIVRLIGNVKGRGLQASKARGLRLRDKTYLHTAPLFKGASGGPLFNESGEVIAINYAETAILKGSKAYNFATPLKFIKADLENNVSSSVMSELAF